MSRPLRIEFADAYYHVMNRGLERRPIFLTSKDNEYFFSLLNDVWQRWQVKIFAFCLMKNHYHLFLQTPLGNLSRVMRHIDGPYTQYFNRSYDRDGPLFRGRYKAIIVDADSYLLQLVRYIHLNPVEEGFVKDPISYSWSSHRLYVSADSSRFPWLARENVLDQFSTLESFDKFVSCGNDKSLEAFYKRKRFSPFLGSDGFISSLTKRIKPSLHHPRCERMPQFKNITDVVDLVTKKMHVPKDEILCSRRGHENLARNLSIYLASRRAGFPHNEIKKQMNLGSDSAVSRTCQRLEERIHKDPQIFGLVESLLN